MPYRSDLDNALRKLNGGQPAFLLVTKDRVRVRHLEDRLLHFLQVEKQQVSTLFGETLLPKDITSLIDEMCSMNLFSSKQLFRMLKADQMKTATLDAFLKAGFPEDSSNILILHAEQLKSNSRLRKYFTQRKAVLELKPIPEKEMAAWTTSHGAALDIQLSGKVAQLLVDICEHRADAIDQTLTQLKLYCKEGISPTTTDVLSLFPYHPDPNEFLLLEQILTKPPHEGERAIHTLLESGKNAFLILNLIGKSASRLLLMHCLLQERVPQKEIMQRLKIAPWLFEKEMRLLKKVPRKKIELLHSAIVTADSQLKGKSLGIEHIFSQFTHTL